MLRLLIALAVTACLGFLTGCDIVGSQSGAATREGARIIADSATDATVAVSAESLAGSWQTPGPNEGATPTRDVLSFDAAGTGAAWGFVDFEGPGLTDTFEFNYSIEGNRVVLNFEDGQSEAFVVQSLKPSLMVSSREGTATWVSTGVWTKHSK